MNIVLGVKKCKQKQLNFPKTHVTYYPKAVHVNSQDVGAHAHFVCFTEYYSLANTYNNNNNNNILLLLLLPTYTCIHSITRQSKFVLKAHTITRQDKYSRLQVWAHPLNT